METNKVEDAAAEETTGTAIEKEVLLSDGRKVTILKGKGKHGLQAMRMSEGAQDKYMSALMSMLVLIDGNKIVMEDIEELPLKDFMTIQVEFSGKNF